MDDFILGYLIGAGSAWLGIISGILFRRRRPKPVQLPPGFVPPSAALTSRVGPGGMHSGHGPSVTTHTDLRTGVTTYLRPGPLASEHSLRCIATFDGVNCTCRPTTPDNITAPKGSSK